MERRTGSGKGLAMWRIPVTSFNAESNAPSVVMSGTITNSSLSWATNGAMRGWFWMVVICSLLRTEMRTRYPDVRALFKVAKPTNPVAPVS